jgi:hypothetical protein
VEDETVLGLMAFFLITEGVDKMLLFDIFLYRIVSKVFSIRHYIIYFSKHCINP